ncbi:MAG: S41 family peptidase [Bacteroidales bacterium]|nr:S41 family peptidase [Bacteroidales bacterium]MDZ4204361.1 S41 family peptidase [Bacteroidales bacterium]
MKPVAQLLRHNICIIAVFTLLFVHISPTRAQLNDSRMALQKFTSAYQLINMAYVDTLNQQKLIETAIVEMLKELDPHSVYLSKADVDKANEPLVGNFEGIGVQFQIFKDTIVVTAAIADGPSEKVGIMAGDKIVKIDGEDSFGNKITNDYVLGKLRGKKDTKVNVSIFRQGEAGLLDFTITRDKIPLNSIDATFIISPGLGYIRLNRFSRTTMQEFRQSINQLQAEGMQKLILDLRNNSGGYLDVAVDLSDEFLDHDRMIVYTAGLRSPRMDFKATPRGSLHSGRLIVMINEGSASASEIVAGAVQDWDRGLVMGRRSFGKGLVQRPFNLPDSSVIRLTTAKYFTPSGRSIQKPYNEGVKEYHMDLRKRLEHGEMVYADSIRFPDSLRFYTNNKRVVYGGGGIMPDIFLPIDTTSNSAYYTSLFRKGVFNSFTMEYLNTNRRRLEKLFPTTDKFFSEFDVDGAFLQQFIEYAAKQGVEKDDKGLEVSEKNISHLLKANIARNLFDLNAYYRISLAIDNELQQAIITMSNDKAFANLLNGKR